MIQHIKMQWAIVLLFYAEIDVQIDYFLLQQGYFGKEGKNLLKSIDYHSVFTSLDKMTYQYDNSGRITDINNAFEITDEYP